MKLVSSDGRTAHLGYCFNVLPGETVAELVQQIHRICGPVRRRLGVDRLGVGLWIAQPAAFDLDASKWDLRDLKEALDAEGLYCFTLNGFPYGGFHGPRVKELVFLPSWADGARIAYTATLASILAKLLPDDLDGGSISTVPLGPSFVDRDNALAGVRRASQHLADVTRRTGKRMTLAIEPEPGAKVERASDLAAMLAGLGNVGVCLDTCHAAVVDEDPRAAFETLRAAGVPCAKIQISSALVAAEPGKPEVRAALAAFAEPRFFHQVRCAGGGTMDLPEALAGLDTSSPWRIHFHVPVHREDIGSFATTRDRIAPVIQAALDAPGPLPHLEVETYTWSVLPAESPARRELVQGLREELDFVAGLVCT